MRTAQTSQELYLANDRGTIKCDNMAAWNKHMPLSLTDAQKILSADLPPVRIEFHLNVTENSTEPERSSILVVAINGDFYVNRTFDPLHKTADAGEVKVKNQRTGIGRILMRNDLDLSFKTGCLEHSIFASSTHGGYTWAKFGFLPKLEHTNFLKEKLSNTFNALSPFMMKAQRNELSTLIKLRDATDIWHIADMQDDVRPWIDLGKNPSDAAILSRLKIFMNTARGREDNLSSILRIEDRLQAAKGEHTLGKCFLMGSQWFGAFEFKNIEQRHRASAYVGGFNYIPSNVS